MKETILRDLREMAQLVIDKGEYAKKIEAAIHKRRNEVKKTLDSLRKKVSQLQDENQKFLKLLANDVISQAEYRAGVDGNHQEIQRLQAKILELESQLGQQIQHDTLIQRLMTELDGSLKFDDLTEDLLHRLVERIEVKADGQPVVYYRFEMPLTSQGVVSF